MDLRDDVQTNLADLSDQLHQIARVEYSAAKYEEISQRLDDLATYLDTYIIPRMTPATRYIELLAFDRLRESLPPRPMPELIAQVAGSNGAYGDEPDAA